MTQKCHDRGVAALTKLVNNLGALEEVGSRLAIAAAGLLVSILKGAM